MDSPVEILHDYLAEESAHPTSPSPGRAASEPLVSTRTSSPMILPRLTSPVAPLLLASVEVAHAELLSLVHECARAHCAIPNRFQGKVICFQ